MGRIKRKLIKAQGLIVAVMVLAITFGLAAGYLAFSRYAYENSQRNLNATRAYYLAQSGLEIAKYTLTTRFDDAAYTGTAKPLNFAGGTIMITVGAKDASSGTRRVTSTGTVNNARQEIVKDYLKTTAEQEVIWAARTDGTLLKLNRNGNILWERKGFNFGRFPGVIAVNPNDGSCWAGSSSEAYNLFKFARDGAELARFSVTVGASSVAVNPGDGSCWVGGGARVNPNIVTKIRSDGTAQVIDGFGLSTTVSVDPRDGSCWVADQDNNKLVKLDSGGNRIMAINATTPVFTVIDSRDGSFWVLLGGNRRRIVKFDSSGTERAEIDTFSANRISISPLDGSLWAATQTELHKYDPNGRYLFAKGHWDNIMSIAASPLDDACWVWDDRRSGLVKVGGDGTTQEQICIIDYRISTHAVLTEPQASIEEAQ